MRISLRLLNRVVLISFCFLLGTGIAHAGILSTLNQELIDAADRAKEINNILADLKLKICNYSCEVVSTSRGIKLGKMKLFAQESRCKNLKKCELVVREGYPQEVGIYCKCGHTLRNHVFEFYKGIDETAVLKELYKYEVKM